MEVVSMEGDENRLTQQRFEAAVKVIKSLPSDGSFQPSNDMMLKFYSYYKQATLGPCNVPRPGFWDAVGKAKWDAWNSLGDMPKEEAMAAYVDEMKLILEGMPITEEVEGLLKILGPFYELVDEKKKITQISDLSAARLTQFARQLEGIGTMMSGVATKSMAKSIIRTMEMNGTLETRPSRPQPLLDSSGKDEEELGEEEEEEEEEEDDEDDEEDEDEVVIKEVKKEKKSSASLPKKKASARRSKMPLSNGQLAAHMTNGTHSKAALNSDDSQEDPRSSAEPRVNGHHIDSNGDACGPQHLTSDSDSEVYCDSVDQFGQEESSENHQSMDDLDEEENHVTTAPPLLEEPRAPLRVPAEDSPSPPEGIQCGGEDGEAGGPISQGQRQSAPDSSLVRRGRGSRSSGLGSGVPGAHVQGSGDGDGEPWGGAGGAPGGSLNQQIVVALARLQEDMQSVLERLHTLEALTATQARSMALSPTYSPRPANKSSKKPAWWPFDVSPSTVAFAVIWPFVVQWLLRLFLQRRKRRTN